MNEQNSELLELNFVLTVLLRHDGNIFSRLQRNRGQKLLPPLTFLVEGCFHFSCGHVGETHSALFLRSRRRFSVCFVSPSFRPSLWDCDAFLHSIYHSFFFFAQLFKSLAEAIVMIFKGSSCWIVQLWRGFHFSSCLFRVLIHS